VRKALMQGGQKAVAESQDTMLALARLVDARSRMVRQQLEEKISEPCRQAYTVLTRVQEQIRGDEFYPDATGTLRLSFGNVQPYGDSKIMQASRAGIVSLADIFRWLKESRQETVLPKNWQAARSELDEEAPILFGCTADVVPGSSGSPIVDRQGRLVGVAARGNAVQLLDYRDGESGCGAVAARGILEVLDKVYHAAELVKELGGNGDPSRIYSNKQKEAPTPPLPLPLPLGAPSIIAGPPPPPPSPSRSQGGSSSSTAFPLESFGPDSAQPDPLLPPLPPSSGFDPTRPGYTPAMPGRPSFVNPFPPQGALLCPAPEPPTFAAEKAPSLGNRHKELVPALIKALKDSDAEVRQAAATGLENLGGDALSALIEALQAKDKSLRCGAALVLGKLGREGQNAIPALIRALEDEDVEVRRQAAHALASVVRDCRQASDGPPPCHPLVTGR
jgi:Peptidase S46/HEAT repeats/HEAT-like repeat